MVMHHIGYVVRDIARYAETMPGLTEFKSVIDSFQDAKLSLYDVGGGPFIELIQPLSHRAFTWSHLERYGEGMHHICYEGLPLSAVEQLVQRHRMITVRGPIYATLFDRDVLFAVTRHKAIIEFLL